MTNEELIAAYRAGDADALNELAKQNKGLIASVARDWCERERYWDDTFQECSLSFLLAAHAFNLEARKSKFSTYATVAMNRHMRNLVEYRSAQKRTAKVGSLHENVSDKTDCPALIAQRMLDADYLLSLIPQTRTRKIVWLAMQGYTHPEVAKMTGVSFQRISQIKCEGLQKIRECLSN